MTKVIESNGKLYAVTEISPDYNKESLESPTRNQGIRTHLETFHRNIYQTDTNGTKIYGRSNNTATFDLLPLGLFGICVGALCFILGSFAFKSASYQPKPYSVQTETCVEKGFLVWSRKDCDKRFEQGYR